MKPAILLLLYAVFISAPKVSGQSTVPNHQEEKKSSDNNREESNAPVTLLNFKSFKTTGKEITITWTTEKEVNNDFFKLERSINGIDFSTIALLKAKNKSYIYSVTDGHPLSNYNFSNYVYYRLSQTDTEGRTKYFDVMKMLLRGAPGVLMINPNPVKDQLQIQLRCEEKGHVTISVVTHNGVPLKQWLLMKNDEIFYETFSVSDLPEGNYILQAKIRLVVETQNFVKR